MQDDRPLGYYLKRVLGRIGSGGYATELEVRKAYEDLAGNLITSLTQSFNMQGTTLYLRVATPTLRHELLMRRSTLMRAINCRLGREAVKRIVVL